MEEAEAEAEAAPGIRASASHWALRGAANQKHARSSRVQSATQGRECTLARQGWGGCGEGVACPLEGEGRVQHDARARPRAPTHAAWTNTRRSARMRSSAARPRPAAAVAAPPCAPRSPQRCTACARPACANRTIGGAWRAPQHASLSPWPSRLVAGLHLLFALCRAAQQAVQRLDRRRGLVIHACTSGAASGTPSVTSTMSGNRDSASASEWASASAPRA